jgi:hypothetical protein
LDEYVQSIMDSLVSSEMGEVPFQCGFQMAGKAERRRQTAQIELTQVDIELLREILKRYLSELIMEIAYSDRKDFREFLKKRREFMEDFIQRLDKELASGKREMIGIDQLRGVEILQELAEWELQSIAQFLAKKPSLREVPYAKKVQGPTSSISSSKGVFPLVPRSSVS